MNTAQFKGSLQYKHYVTDDVLELHFEKPSNFDYQAGQYIEFLIPKDGDTAIRPFSLASAPIDTKYVKFCCKIVPGGLASTYFNQMSLGSFALWRGPFGSFTYQDGIPPLVLIATGTGLAPIYSLLHHALEKMQTGRPVKLIFGVRSEANIFWADRLHDLAQRYQNFSYIIVLSNPSALWNGPKGYVADHIGGTDNISDFYLSGSDEMAQSTYSFLCDRGVSPSTIHREIYI
ncbi:MAG: FAD-binding oxidoreductase [bacterium]|nr:FAD-binding oxidoreductase [bacterium]